MSNTTQKYQYRYACVVCGRLSRPRKWAQGPGETWRCSLSCIRLDNARIDAEIAEQTRAAILAQGL